MAESRFDLSDCFPDVDKYKQLRADFNKYKVEEEENDKQVKEIENGIQVYKNVKSEDERTQVYLQIGILFRLIQMQNCTSFGLINSIDDKFKSLEDKEEILSEVDAAIRTLNKVTAQDLFSTNSLATPIFSRAGNLNYAKMLQDIANYEGRMEQKVMLKVIKNALEVYQEFTIQDKYESKKRCLVDQIQLLFLFMRLKFDPDNEINSRIQCIFDNFVNTVYNK